jgi:hypothetical protein
LWPIGDLADIGPTIEDLDLDLDDALPALPDRPRWQPGDSWRTSDAENHFFDLPSFQSHAERARFFINAMARRALDGRSPDARVLPHRGRMVSLNDLLQTTYTTDVVELVTRMVDADPR